MKLAYSKVIGYDNVAAPFFVSSVPNSVYQGY